MAEFNPQTPNQPTDFTRSSQGYKADLSMGGLFDDAASLLTSTVKAGTELFNEVISREATASVDAVRDEEIRAGLSAKAGGPPLDLTKAVDRVGTLSAAKDVGAIGGSHYELLLDAEARKLRARYPGHREFIDRKISELTGGTPANMAIRDLKAETAKTNADPEKALLNAGVNWAVAHGGEANTWLQKYGTPPPLPMLLAMNARQGAVLAETDRLSKSLSLDEQNRKASELAVATQAQGILFSQLDGEGRTALAGAGIEWDALQKTINDQKEFTSSGKPVPKEIQEKLAEDMRVYKEKANKIFDDTVYGPRILGDGKRGSFAQFMNTEKIDALRKSYNDRLTGQTDPIEKGDYSRLANNTAYIKAAENAELARVYHSSEFALQEKTMRSILGDQAYSMYTNNAGVGATYINARSKLVKDYIGGKLFNKTTLDADITEGEALARKAGMTEEEAARFKGSLIDNYVKMLAHPTMNAEGKAAIVNKLFSGDATTDFYAKAGPEARALLYGKLMDPKMVDAIMTMPAATKDKYIGWVDKAFSNRMREGVDTAKEVSRASGNKALVFNVTTNNFDVVEKPGAPRVFGGDGGYDARMNQLKGNLNRTINNWIPVAEKIGMSPEMIQQYISRQFELGGAKRLVAPPEEGKEGSRPSKGAKAPEPDPLEPVRVITSPQDLVNRSVTARAVPVQDIKVKTQGQLPEQAVEPPRKTQERLETPWSTNTLTMQDVASRPPQAPANDTPQADPALMKIVERAGRYYILPSSFGGKEFSDREMIARFSQDKKNYGIYGSKEDAEKQIERLSQEYRRFRESR